MKNEKSLVWYDIKYDEIFLDWRFDCWFFGLCTPKNMRDKYICLGKL